MDSDAPRNELSTDAQLQESIDEQSRLKEKNENLKNLSPEEKIRIFRGLFRGREDVYAVRWISKNGKPGYSPACANERSKKLCNKYQTGCSECKNKKLLPLTDGVIYSHLTGKQTIGIYQLLTDETCWFLAVDFDMRSSPRSKTEWGTRSNPRQDVSQTHSRPLGSPADNGVNSAERGKSSWQDDAAIFLSTCKEMDVPAALERSRSGNGCHVWIFFQENVPAALARKAGTVILTKAKCSVPQITLHLLIVFCFSVKARGVRCSHSAT